MRNILMTGSAIVIAAALSACGATDEPAPTPETPEVVGATAEAQTPEATADAEEQAEAVELGSTGTYVIDPGHTSLLWKVDHLGISNYTARFTDIDATLEFNPEDTSATALSVTIDPTSVATNYVGDYKATHADSEFETWDEDLAMSDKWFNANAHDTITYTATAITKTGPNSGTVTGDLTLLGVTQPVTLDVTYNGTLDMRGTERIGFSATGKIDRTAFGMTANVPYVGAEVDIIIETEFTKPSE